MELIVMLFEMICEIPSISADEWEDDDDNK